MEGIALERLERIARNLPIVSPLEMIQVETDLGIVYIAYGRDAMGLYHGAWGCRGTARTISFNDTATEKIVRQFLLDDAHGFTQAQHDRGMLAEGFWRKRP